MKNVQYNYAKPLWRSGRQVTRRQGLNNIREQYDQNHNTTTVFLVCFLGQGVRDRGRTKLEEKRKEGDEKGTVNLEINFSSYSPEL